MHGRQSVSGSHLESLGKLGSDEPQLFYRRASTILPSPNGKNVAFGCFDQDGHYYFCKADDGYRPVRATEIIFTRLADRLGIRTAEWAIIEHNHETFFGSRQEISSATHFQTRAYLEKSHSNELGQPANFPGEHLAQLLALDLFMGNPDRGANNFLLVKDGNFIRLCAIDFADGDLAGLGGTRFPVAGTTTTDVGRRYRQIHGQFDDAAIEMVDRIAALPASAFLQIVSEVRDDWLSADLRGGLNEVWGSPGFCRRLTALRSVLEDGTLL